MKRASWSCERYVPEPTPYMSRMSVSKPAAFRCGMMRYSFAGSPPWYPHESRRTEGLALFAGLSKRIAPMPTGAAPVVFDCSAKSLKLVIFCRSRRRASAQVQVFSPKSSVTSKDSSFHAGSSSVRL